LNDLHAFLKIVLHDHGVSLDEFYLGEKSPVPWQHILPMFIVEPGN